jgi:hypothetical protein
MQEEATDKQRDAIERRFGFVVESHRIGEMNITVAQVDRVDAMIRERYPEAVTTHGDAPVWMITWPAAFGLAEYLLLNQPVSGMRARGCPGGKHRLRPSGPRHGPLQCKAQWMPLA